MENLTEQLQKKLNLAENQVQKVEKIAVQDKDIVVNEQSYKNVKVKDYYVEEGEEEDENKKFFSSEEFHDNIRRGLSVIEDIEKNSKEVLRKGHKKFDDLTKGKLKMWLGRFLDQNFIKDKIQEILASNKKQLSENDKKQILKKYPAKFQDFSTMFIYRTVKDDGTCSQISYCKSAQAWVICTKNESLLLKQKQEAENIGKQFNFIKEMALLWFEYLENLNNELKEELQTYLSDKTLLAELCGGVAKQYVKYGPNPVLICFSIVNNYSEDICFSPPDAETVFKKFNLKYRQHQKTIECDNYRDFYQLFKQINVEVNNSSFLEKGEGEVLYICGRPKLKPEQIIVLKMAKAKTIEYKLIKEGEKYVNRLNYVKSETSQNLIKDFIEIFQKLPKLKNLSISAGYLASTIRLMQNNNIKIDEQTIKNYIVNEFGEEKLNILQS
ncbi:hypothetical protein ABPG72_013768 [Tetrahymena utriculariae]